MFIGLPTCEVFAHYDGGKKKCIAIQDGLSEREARKFFEEWSEPGQRIVRITLERGDEVLSSYEF